MLNGNSILHVNQGPGLIYSTTEIKGYYNDLTEKVIKRENLDTCIPMSYIDTGEKIFFPIEIFQYGLGAYDLYLLNNDNLMLKKTISCANWAIENQQTNGGWSTFAHQTPNHPYSSMAQGEGISLLVRMYIETNNKCYYNAAKRAIDFMLLSIENGGTTKYKGDWVYFLECTHEPLVLNGWIFSIWGIVDYYKLTKNVYVKQVLDATLMTLENKVSYFDKGFWSMYDCEKRICSPFYHKLHIAQLRVMYDLSNRDVYRIYADKWEKYQQSFCNRKRAFMIKVVQKICE